MKKITNREEANFYYKKINDIVKKYTSSKARPSEVRRFIENNLDRILNREGLKDVLGINRIVDDVLDHHNSIETDGVMTYESFTFLNPDGDTFPHQKFLGDLFDCDLDNIKLVNSDINFFEINSFGTKSKVFIFSKEEFLFIREQLIDKLVDEFGNELVSVKEIEEIPLGKSISARVGDFWIESEVRSKFENEFTDSRFRLFLPSMISKHLGISDKVDLVCSPPNHDFYVYSLGSYDLIFRLGQKLM